MLRTTDAIRMGIHPRTRYALRDSGEVEQVSCGFYRLTEKPALANPDLVAVALRIPRAVICLISALAYHGLTTEIPHSVDVALPGHAQIPKLGGIPLRAFWYSEPFFSAGLQTVSIDGVAVRIYSPEKSIADCFKYRNKIGLDLAIQALRTYRERPKKPEAYLEVCCPESGRAGHAALPGGGAVSGSDIGASVRQRLLNRARAEERPFQELSQYFAMERFLYRLAKSAFADRFVLKDAILPTAWKAPVTGPTMDIDLGEQGAGQ